MNKLKTVLLRSKIIIITFSLIIGCSTSFSQWTQTAGTPEGGGTTDMVITSNGTIVVTCANYNYPSGQLGGIRHSTNGGMTWVNDFQHYTARTLALGQNDFVFASSWNYPTTTEGLYVSTDQGITWTTYRYLVGANNNIFSILVRDNNQTVYIGTRTGVLKSTNGGFAFSPVNNGIPANSWVWDLESDSLGVIAAATSNGLFISQNAGTLWQQTQGVPAGDTVTCLTFSQSSTDANGTGKFLAGTDDGKVLISDAPYLNFNIGSIIRQNTILEGLAAVENYLYACGRPKNPSQDGGGVFQSTNGGQNWIYLPEGLPMNSNVACIYPHMVYVNGQAQVFIGLVNYETGLAQIYKRNFPIGIQQISNEVPNTFSLSQNYPNPFNPMTKIKFEIHKASNVNITVFDVLGRHITTLVNEKLNAGTYETDWNANNLPGGVYFYRLETDDFSETKKMILVK